MFLYGGERARGEWGAIGETFNCEINMMQPWCDQLSWAQVILKFFMLLAIQPHETNTECREHTWCWLHASQRGGWAERSQNTQTLGAYYFKKNLYFIE